MFTPQQFLLAGIVMVVLVAVVFYLGRTQHKDEARRCRTCGQPISVNAKSCPKCGDPI